MSDSEQKPTQTEVPYTAPYYSSLLAGLIHKLNNVATVLTGNAGLLLMGFDFSNRITDRDRVESLGEEAGDSQIGSRQAARDPARIVPQRRLGRSNQDHLQIRGGTSWELSYPVPR